MNNYKIRPIQLKDSLSIFKIVNDPEVRAQSFSHTHGKITLEEHRVWFKKRLSRKEQPFLVFEFNGRVVGYIRFDKQDSKSFSVGIALTGRARGRGLGNILLSNSLKMVENQLESYTIIAKIKNSNPASQRLFEKNNFQLVKKYKNYTLNSFKYSKNIVIATIKPWNIVNYKKLKNRYKQYNWFLINHPKELTYQKLKKINPKYVFIPHWSRIITDEIWSNFECVVFHATDLPYGRGGTPIHNLIMRGYKKTKISALRVEAGLDTGPIYLKEDLDLSGSGEQIYNRMSNLIFKKMIPYFLKNNPIPKPQAGKAVVFKRRKPGQSKINNNLDLSKLYDFIRMLDTPTYPMAFLETKKLKFEFYNIQKTNKDTLQAKVKIYEK